MTEPLLLSVVVPAFDEAARIGPTLRSISAGLIDLAAASEIVVVDDGSSDATADVVSTLARELPGLRLVRSGSNRGKGSAVRLGMLAARGDLRLYMDADNATPIEELPKLLAAIDEGADIAIGSRRAAGGGQRVKQPWFRRAWSHVANKAVQAVLLDGIQDTQCGFKLFRARAADAIFARARVPGWGFDLEVLVLARTHGFRIAECGVIWSDDRRSRIHPIRDAVNITRELISIRRSLRRGDYDAAKS